jgi:hypothetical protein
MIGDIGIEGVQGTAQFRGDRPDNLVVPQLGLVAANTSFQHAIAAFSRSE